MERTMTAADRAPQVGDVLRYHGRNARVVATDKVFGVFRWGYARAWYSLEDGRAHKYVTRADGGPLTVKEAA